MFIASSQDLSAPVERFDIPDQPAPSLHPPPQQAGASPLLRAGPPACAASVLSAFGYPPRHAPFRDLGGLRPRPPYRRSPAHRPVPEPRTRLTPPSRRAPPGQYSGRPPGSSQGNSQTPRFRCHLDYANDASSAHARSGLLGLALLERLPDPHLTRSSAPSPCRSPRRSSANAAQGGLAPSPEGDAGGPTSLHLQHSTASERGLLHNTSFNVRDTRLSHKAVSETCSEPAEVGTRTIGSDGLGAVGRCATETMDVFGAHPQNRSSELGGGLCDTLRPMQ
jgi:hypothetical protein